MRFSSKTVFLNGGQNGTKRDGSSCQAAKQHKTELPSCQ